MRYSTALLFILAITVSGSAAETVNALDALKLLPPDQAARLVHIEGRDGTPVPDRWYLIVHDETAKDGLREFAVAGKDVVASRTISQFAEKAQAEDVLAKDQLNIDSDRVARIAQEYARANNVSIGSLNYSLQKDVQNERPIWKVTCVDEAGKKLGELMLTANKGTVLSHEGFEEDPDSLARKRRAQRTTTRSRPVMRPDQPPPQPELPGDKIGNTLRRFFGGGH